MTPARRRPTRDQQTRQRRQDARTTRRGTTPWPFPGDLPIDRARTLATEAVEQWARHDPDGAAAFRAQAHAFGETWLAATPVATAGEWLTTEQVAALAGVGVRAVNQWTTRDTRAGRLTRHPQGFHEREVADFLAQLRTREDHAA